MKKHSKLQVDGSGSATPPHLLTTLMANAGVATSRAKPSPPGSSLAPSRYIRQDTLLRMVPWSASTLWRKVKNGSFVRPVKLSDRITAWDREAVLAWLREREAS